MKNIIIFFIISFVICIIVYIKKYNKKRLKILTYFGFGENQSNIYNYLNEIDYNILNEDNGFIDSKQQFENLDNSFNQFSPNNCINCDKSKTNYWGIEENFDKFFENELFTTINNIIVYKKNKNSKKKL